MRVINLAECEELYRKHLRFYCTKCGKYWSSHWMINGEVACEVPIPTLRVDPVAGSMIFDVDPKPNKQGPHF